MVARAAAVEKGTLGQVRACCASDSPAPWGGGLVTDTQMWHLLPSSPTPGMCHEVCPGHSKNCTAPSSSPLRPTPRPCVTSFTASFCLSMWPSSAVDSSSLVYHHTCKSTKLSPPKGVWSQRARPMSKSPSLNLGYQYSDFVVGTVWHVAQVTPKMLISLPLFLECWD